MTLFFISLTKIFIANAIPNEYRGLKPIFDEQSRYPFKFFDNQAAYHFGQIRAALYRTGQPIGPYDMMIAGQARAAGLKLVTNNVKEFERVPGLLLENWI